MDEHTDPPPDTLKERKNRLTRWEVVLVTPEKNFRLGFSARKTNEAIVEMARANSDLVIEVMEKFNCPDDGPSPKKQRWNLRNGVVIRFGRTERAIASELNLIE